MHISSNKEEGLIRNIPSVCKQENVFKMQLTKSIQMIHSGQLYHLD